MTAIKEFFERVAEEFRPRQIIFFGSYACGRPTEDSDVDLAKRWKGGEFSMKPLTREWVEKAEGDFELMERLAPSRSRRLQDGICFHAHEKSKLQTP